jgi:nucleotide-binding universal stress UspA family protein
VLERKHILFPVDFSARCRATTPFVIEMARQLSARVTVFHVFMPPTLVYPVDMPWVAGEADIEAQRDLADKSVRQFVADQFEPVAPEITTRTAFELGDPATTIVEFAEKTQVNLIMLPTQGHGRFRSLLLGSVTSKVLHDARCPVWTSAHIQDPLSAAAAKVRSILCALDVNRESLNVLAYAADLSRTLAAEIHIVHAVAAGDSPERIAAASAELSRVQEKAGTAIEIGIQPGQPHEVIREAAGRLKADLVVIGRGAILSPLGRLRTNVHGIVRSSPCPVISV